MTTPIAEKIKNKINATLFTPPWVYLTGKEILLESIRDLLDIRPNHSDDNLLHLQYLAEWICRAQDATADNGVARSYSISYRPFFKRKGWFESYPETTGYIIPTFFDYHHYTGNQEYFDRALRMADWECDVQLESGAVMGGTVDFPPSPAVFNTGQVIFGWCRAYLETKNEKYINAAMHAGDYLVDALDDTGQWQIGTSKFAAADSTVYNTRVSWALTLLDSLVDKGKYRAAAMRNIDWALSKQNDLGWFSDNCLDDPDKPLVHTIAYTIQGILEAGLTLNNTVYIESAKKAATVMVDKLREDGSLAGRYDRQWSPAANWSCVTGDAQMSIIWSRLYQMDSNPIFYDASKKINRFCRSIQNLRTQSTGRRGGVKGAYPVYGDYGTFEYLNWAVKFLMDALLLEQKNNKDKKIDDLEKNGIPMFWAS